MQNLWIFIGLILACALLWVWLPFFSSKRTKYSETSRKEENKQAYWDRKNELEEEFAQGKISESIYNARLEELSMATLQELKSDEPEARGASDKLNVLWPLSITAIVLSISLLTYSQVGYTPSSEEIARQKQQEQQKTELTKNIAQLVSKVAADGSSSQDWFSLAYLYIESGDYQKAINAFDKVQSLIGEHAEILGGKAQALYYLEGEKLSAPVNAIIEKALSLDPVDPATNILLGMHNYREGQFTQATKHWQRVMRSSRDDINKSALLQSIRASQQQAGITAQDYSVAVTVELDSALASNTSPTDTVFIYAHAPEQKMPLAIHRTTVSELPLSVTLTDEQAMSPIASLSSVDEVIVKAVVSKSGSAGMQAGDLFAESAPIDTLSGQNVLLQIDRQYQLAQSSNRTSINVEINIAAHILSQVSNDDTVFIFAAPSSGAKVPLVAEKIKVGDLPASVVLQNTTDQPDLLAQAEVIDIHALVTKPGQQGFSRGTPRGMKEKIRVNTDLSKEDVTNVVITIDSLVGEG